MPQRRNQRLLDHVTTYHRVEISGGVGGDSHETKKSTIFDNDAGGSFETFETDQDTSSAQGDGPPNAVF